MCVIDTCVKNTNIVYHIYIIDIHIIDERTIELFNIDTCVINTQNIDTGIVDTCVIDKWTHTSLTHIQYTCVVQRHVYPNLLCKYLGIDPTEFSLTPHSSVHLWSEGRVKIYNVKMVNTWMAIAPQNIVKITNPKLCRSISFLHIYLIIHFCRDLDQIITFTVDLYNLLLEHGTPNLPRCYERGHHSPSCTVQSFP